MIDQLDARMADVLAKMSVISEQKARHYEGISVHGGEPDRTPQPLADKPLVDYYRDRFNRAYSASSRRAVLQDATHALEVAKRAVIPPGQPPAPDDPQWKRWVAESPLPTVEIARLFNVSRQYVHQVRCAYRITSDGQV